MAKATARDSKTKTGYNALKAELRQGSWRRLYVLYGEETFLIDKLVEALGELLITAGSAALDRVVLQQGGRAGRLEPARVQAEVMTPPFLSRCKLVIVRQSGWFSSSRRSTPAEETDDETEQNGSSSSGTQQTLLELLAALPDSACLVFVEDKVDRRLKTLVTAVEKAGVLVDMGKQQPQILQRWIEAECKRQKLTIETLAAQSLIDRCEGSMQVIRQELDKLFLYCQGSGVTRVTARLVDDLSLPDLHGSIFDMTDALAAGRADRALELADVLISQKQPVQLIQFMLARHLRQLICAAELSQPGQIAAALKVPPFVAGRLARQARDLPPEQLEKLYQACFQADIAVKSGRISDRLALETLLVESATAIAAACRP
ncbi:MAG: DNA polymerase III subunit delta [Ruminococcaceae bacterium]|nr:DNA polymerase III subunit delta [Oscillospiraceae bacterium]